LVEPGPSGALCDILWADPWHEKEEGGGGGEGAVAVEYTMICEWAGRKGGRVCVKCLRED